ncbi:PseG/SpsG family protein [Asticcacaulis sp. AC460]|uniref:PseG/SpsG family protein n=1 Tax=Asticcacaulis sp. AC460 TaxID=1282360 RepID=UPI0012DF27EE|nr:hypothetical protein [Asticcacaulis sp. AC460]
MVNLFWTVMTRLLIRTEAGPEIGMGHFMRCFALAEEARARGVAVVFLINEISDTVRTRCESIGASAEIVTGFDMLPVEAGDRVVIDSYKATAAYISGITAPVAVIDDLENLDRYDCAVIVNPALAARAETYTGKTSARLLLGPQYALIRQEFRSVVTPEAEPFVAITLGGSDPAGLTGPAARHIHEVLTDMSLRVIAGPANRHIDELRASGLPRMELFVAPPSVAEVLAGARLVVVGAGGSLNEVAAMGLPGLAVVAYDNQQAELEACPFPVVDARAGLQEDFGERVRNLATSPERLDANARHAHAMIDGLGTKRVVDALFSAGGARNDPLSPRAGRGLG